MAKRKATIERAPDMLREPEKYFDTTFSGEEYRQMKDEICRVAGIDDRHFFWDLEEPTKARAL
jgi:hypothetical protein